MPRDAGHSVVKPTKHKTVGTPDIRLANTQAAKHQSPETHLQVAIKRGIARQAKSRFRHRVAL